MRNEWMKIGILAALAAFWFWTPVPAQEDQIDRVVVPLSNPGKPAFVRVEVMTGEIKVIGTEGQEVVIEARAGGKSLLEGMKPGKQVEGMRLIQSSSTGLEVEEKDNRVHVETDSLTRRVDLLIKIPRNSSLKLHSVKGGDIIVENIIGEVEAENVNGDVILTGISGTVVAGTVNGGLKVTMNAVTPGKPMSFSTVNGDVDVTLPADIKATVKMKSDFGDIYSDFDISLKETAQRFEKDERKEGGKYRIVLERTLTGTINGGGAELKLVNLNGQIYLRKKK